MNVMAAAGALVISGVLAAGCATEAAIGDGTRDGEVSLDDEQLDDELGEGKLDPAEGSSAGDDDRDVDPEAVVEAALLDVETFWTDTYPDVYRGDFEPLDGGYHAYGPETPPDDLPKCDASLTYEDIAVNAFYCPAADLIAWDLPGLVAPLYDQFGAFTIAIVMAHEFGHAVQARAGTSGDTIMLELQADCFAGAWAGHVDAGDADHFEVDLADLDLAVAGFLELRDGLGTTATDPLAHGTGFDRVTAFQDGFERGVERCVDYPDRYEREELVIVEIPFSTRADFERGGNLDPETLIPLALVNLDAFYAQLLDEQGVTWPPVGDRVLLYDPATDEVGCDGETFSEREAEFGSFYCAPDDVIALDVVNLGAELYEIGDFALVIELARLYALRAQDVLGVDADVARELLHADCLTGIYSAATFLELIDVAEESKLVLSPGDLDEAIIAFLAYGGSDDDASAFTRADAFKDGFLEGTAACDQLLG